MYFPFSLPYKKRAIGLKLSMVIFKGLQGFGWEISNFDKKKLFTLIWIEFQPHADQCYSLVKDSGGFWIEGEERGERRKER